jgi:integrative and conjugative element protein (TIGR02256 family)
VREATVAERLTFARPKYGRFQIGPDSLAVMRQYIQDEPDKLEAGGVLLGRHILGTNDIIVDYITTPLQGDKRSRTRFFRRRQRHQQVIDQTWQESKGTCTYLGEWHTHPELSPLPSLLDRLEWQRKLIFDQFTEPIFFVIVGIEETRVWEGRHFSLPVRLRQE